MSNLSLIKLRLGFHLGYFTKDVSSRPKYTEQEYQAFLRARFHKKDVEDLDKVYEACLKGQKPKEYYLRAVQGLSHVLGIPCFRELAQIQKEGRSLKASGSNME